MIEDLTLTAGPVADTGSGCGCGGCGTSAASARETGEQAAPAEGVRATYEVLGMTCGHCAGAVTGELTAVDGVTSVDVELVPGGTSLVHVRSASPLERSVVAAAVYEAGYELVTS